MKYIHTFQLWTPLLSFPHRAVISTRYEKNVRGFFTCWNFHLLICGKSLDNLVLFFYMCLFHMHFWQENALQYNMVIVRFSPKTISRHKSNDITLTSTRYRYEHALSSCRSNGKTNLLEQSWIVYHHPGCTWAVPLDSSQGLWDRFDGTWKIFFFSDKQE